MNLHDPSTLLAWHEAECGTYREDLALWRRMAGPEPRDILELGCGSGRVAMDLAERGHRVTGLDLDPVLLGALESRAPAVTGIEADVRNFDIGRSFDLILAPMQMFQLLTEPTDRQLALTAVHRHLAAGGRFAAALLDLDREIVPPSVNLLGEKPLEPDSLDIGPGRRAISRTTSLSVDEEGLMTVTRRRELLVSDPESAEGPVCADAMDYSYRLCLIDESRFEEELAAAGMSATAWHSVAPTELHLGSLVVVAEAI